MKKPKKKKLKTADRILMGLAWLWSREGAIDSGDAVDLETIDAWRRGLLSPKRSREVKRQLANDPRLMQELLELEAADDLIKELDTTEQIHEENQGIIASVRKQLHEIFENFNQTLWVGGFSASAAAILLVVFILPVTTTQSVESQLNGLYADLHKPPDSLQVPWTPKFDIRGGVVEPGGASETKLNDLLALAFQSGMAEGIHRFEKRFPSIALNPGDYVSSGQPSCFDGVTECEQQVELANATGAWAVAAFLDCQNQPDSSESQAFSILRSLQKAWRDSGESDLRSDILAITVDGDRCLAVESLLRDWGRPTVQIK